MRALAWVGLLTVLLGAGGGCEEGESSGQVPWSYSFESIRTSINISSSIDVLFVVDDSPAMKPFQAALGRSLENFIQEVPDRLDHGPCSPVRLGVLTTSGDGHLSDRVGTQTWDGSEPSVALASDPSCRIVGPDNLSCLFDPATLSGTAIVGFEGSPYPRGLSALRRFLEGPEAQEFLRPDASLAVIYISPNEDCGEPGEVAEGLPGMDGRICSYAAKGVGPDGTTSHPDDPDHLPYALSPVSALHDQLMSIKGDRVGMVKFLALVGVGDPADPLATAIQYAGADPSAAVTPACALPGCTGDGCGALPGTRAIALASSFTLGENGMVASICEEDFHDDIVGLGGFVTCPMLLKLEFPVLDPLLIAFLLNDQPVPRFSCATTEALIPCSGTDDPACDCVETYRYCRPEEPGCFDPMSPGGAIILAPHFDLCEQCPDGPGHPIVLDLIYVVGP